MEKFLLIVALFTFSVTAKSSNNNECEYYIQYDQVKLLKRNNFYGILSDALYGYISVKLNNNKWTALDTHERNELKMRYHKVRNEGVVWFSRLREGKSYNSLIDNWQSTGAYYYHRVPKEALIEDNFLSLDILIKERDLNVTNFRGYNEDIVLREMIKIDLNQSESDLNYNTWRSKNADRYFVDFVVGMNLIPTEGISVKRVSFGNSKISGKLRFLSFCL